MSFFADNRQRTNNGSFKDLGATLHPYSSAHNTGGQKTFVSNHRPIPNDRPLEIGSCANGDIIPNDGSCFEGRTRANATIITDDQRRLEGDGGINDRISADPDARRGFFFNKIEVHFAIEGIVLGFSVGIQISHITPITFGNVTIHGFIFFEEEGKEIFGKIAFFFGG